ncbi:putative ATP-dependent RNA helicase ddx56, partial [Halocaridina rubra]
LRMFLGQYGISSCILNSELPVTSRLHIIDQFNDGLYDIIIASDEQTLEPYTSDDDAEKIGNRDKESGVARGIDFQFVSNIINFDFPVDINSYIHRVGRTARGENQGTALSLVSVAEMPVFEEVEEKLQALMMSESKVFKDFKFKIDDLDGFRYRVRDAWFRCTALAVRDVRKKELRQELMRSQQLQCYFEDNPKELQVLKHAKSSHGLPHINHLKNIPYYNVPKNLKAVAQVAISRWKDNRNEAKGKSMRANKSGRRLKHSERRFLAKQADPLRSMKFSGFKKKKFGKNKKFS